MSLPSSPWELIALLFLLSLLPMLVVMGSSFLKLSIVFSILRNALGLQQVPPNMAIYGLALVMSVFIMAPTLLAVKAGWHTPLEQTDSLWKFDWDTPALTPYKHFLQKNTEPEEIAYFQELVNKSWPDDVRKNVHSDSLLILLPAFTVSQLIQAFRIGLLVYLPFIAIDLLVSNVLLAMGMMMVSPITISLPFKLLVFMLAGGWNLMLSQLVQSFS